MIRQFLRDTFFTNPILREAVEATENNFPQIKRVFDEICENNGILNKPKLVILPPEGRFGRMYASGIYALPGQDTIVAGHLFANSASAPRQKVLLGHELGHIMLDHAQSAPQFEKAADKVAIAMTGEANSLESMVRDNTRLIHNVLANNAPKPADSWVERTIKSVRRGAIHVQMGGYGPPLERVAAIREARDTVATPETRSWIKRVIDEHNAKATQVEIS